MKRPCCSLASSIPPALPLLPYIGQTEVQLSASCSSSSAGGAVSLKGVAALQRLCCLRLPAVLNRRSTVARRCPMEAQFSCPRLARTWGGPLRRCPYPQPSSKKAQLSLESPEQKPNCRPERIGSAVYVLLVLLCGWGGELLERAADRLRLDASLSSKQGVERK